MKTLVDVLNAIEARVEAIPLPFYDRDPDPTPTSHHWVRLSVDGGNLYSNTLASRQEGLTVYFRPMVVGRSQAATLDALQMVRDALVGWDMFPDEPSSSLVEEEETTPPLLPYTGVALAFLFTVTPTYKIRFDR